MCCLDRGECYLNLLEVPKGLKEIKRLQVTGGSDRNIVVEMLTQTVSIITSSACPRDQHLSLPGGYIGEYKGMEWFIQSSSSWDSLSKQPPLPIKCWLFGHRSAVAHARTNVGGKGSELE